MIKIASLSHRRHGPFEYSWQTTWARCWSQAGGTRCQSVSSVSMVTFVEPTVVPVGICVQSVRSMRNVPCVPAPGWPAEILGTCSLTWEAVNSITVPISVLFPGQGTGVAVGVGVAVATGVEPLRASAGGLIVVVEADGFSFSEQLARSAAPARMKMPFFVFMDSCCSAGSATARHFLIHVARYRQSFPKSDNGTGGGFSDGHQDGYRSSVRVRLRVGTLAAHRTR